MNINTITESPESAQKKLDAYRQQLSRRADAEYEAAAAGYEALAAGKPLVNLTEAINAAGLGADNRPLLAVARADRKQVEVSNGRDNQVLFSTLKRSTWGYVGTLLIPIQTTWGVRARTGYSLVPMIPADVRPAGALRDFLILWEVEGWSDSRLTAVPDRDPLLLRHLAGDLYVVEAAWDLTDLERAIMAGRRSG